MIASARAVSAAMIVALTVGCKSDGPRPVATGTPSSDRGAAATPGSTRLDVPVFTTPAATEAPSFIERIRLAEQSTADGRTCALMAFVVGRELSLGALVSSPDENSNFIGTATFTFAAGTLEVPLSGADDPFPGPVTVAVPSGVRPGGGASPTIKRSGASSWTAVDLPLNLWLGSGVVSSPLTLTITGPEGTVRFPTTGSFDAHFVNAQALRDRASPADR